MTQAAATPEGVPLTLRPADLASKEFAKILLIKLSAVATWCTPSRSQTSCAGAIRTQQIDWLVIPAIGELLRNHPAVDNVIEFSPRYQRSAVGLGGDFKLRTPRTEAPAGPL